MNQLEERLLDFSKECIKYAQVVRQTPVSHPLISQFVRSSTSVGANYSEAQQAISHKDFRSKVFIAKKEIAETLYWLELLRDFAPSSELTEEATEIKKILQSITKKLKDPS